MGAWRNRGTLLTLSHGVVGDLPKAILFYSQFVLKGIKGIQLGIGSSWGSYDTQCHLGFGVGRPLNISGRLNLMWAPLVWWGKVSHLLGMATWHSEKIQGTLILGISCVATNSLDQSHSLPDEWGKDSLGVLWPYHALHRNFPENVDQASSHSTEQDGAKNLAKMDCVKLPSFLESKAPISIYHHKWLACTAGVFSLCHNISFNDPFVTHILKANNVNVNNWGSIVPSVENVQ